MSERFKIVVTIPEALPLVKMIDRDPELLAQEFETIGEGFRKGMPDLPIVVEVHPA